MTVSKGLSLVPHWRWALVFALLFALVAFLLVKLLRLWKTRRPSKRAILWAAASFVAGVSVAVFGPWLVQLAISSIVPREHRWEVTRTTSPDGAVDAVMIASDCGALCSETDLVTVVPRGGKAPTNIGDYPFSADDMADAQLRWKQPHLLEIAYRRALINDFRNVSYPFAKFGDEASWEYKVELRLAPSSDAFSYLREPAR